MTTFLFEEIKTIREYAPKAYKELPKYVVHNLTQKYQIRPYQEQAFRNFITYFENDRLRHRPSQVLFHMATGSGKTLIMAGLILYLYKKAKALVTMGMPMSVLKEDNIFEKIIAIKYDVPNDKPEMFDDYKKAVDIFYDKVLEKNG